MVEARGWLSENTQVFPEAPGHGLPAALRGAGWHVQILFHERRAPRPDTGCHVGRKQVGKATQHRDRGKGTRQGEHTLGNLQT